jgi:ATP-dependent Clp protease adaptor protein ClpS
MAATAEPPVVPEQTTEEKTDAGSELDPGFLVIVWNDPVNFMDYVTHVFMKVFGWHKQKAETHMLEVHQKGRSVVAHEGFEKAEYYVHQLQGYHLHATMEKPA